MPEDFLIRRRKATPKTRCAGRNIINSPANEKNSQFEFVSNSPRDTLAIGRKIAALLAAGSCLALKGNLGSGKTCLTRGIARGLGIKENITSPTYTVINEYQSTDPPCPFYHIDAFRLDAGRDFEDIGGMEIIYSDGISVIEWSERIEKFLPDNAIIVSLEITGPSSRLIKIKGLGKI